MSVGKKVAVFLSARELSKDYYRDLVRSVGKMLVKDNHEVWYGGGYSGLMGELAKTVEHHKGALQGITTAHLLETEAKTHDPLRTAITNTMGERKHLLLINTDIVVILPGGFGTLDELFEALTYNQLGLAKSDIFVLDPDLAKPLKQIVDAFERRGTISKEDASLINYVSSTRELKDAIRQLKKRRD